ncbi:MAG: hypothetical protein CMP23_08915 [Rickettsiales bacterium]|nr:hypothetical protein [Rickettsiales bacterium]|tara:strand:- start:1686 stop:3260 length:1575 start_codon:yes stop_codon:yes gene_type:complete
MGLMACDQFAASSDLETGDEQLNTLDHEPYFEAPVVVMLEDEPCFETMEFLSDDRSVIRFSFSCGTDNIDLEVGDVIAGVISGGYLGRVQSIETEGNNLIVTTEYIPLAEVVEEGEFNVDLQADNGARSLIDLSGKTLYRESLGGMHVESGFRAGYLRVRPETQLGASMQWGKLSRFDAVVGMSVDANFEYYVAASGAHRVDEEFPLTDFEFPFYADVSGIPVVGTIKYEMFVRFVSETTGYLDMTVGSYQGHWDWGMGGRFRPQPGWQEVWDTNSNSTVSGIGIVGDSGWKGRIEFSLRPTLSFYGMVSVGGVGSGYLRGRSDPNCDGLEWSFNDGIRAELTLSVRWLDRFVSDMPLRIPMGNSQWYLAEGNIPWPGDLPNELVPACGGTLPWQGTPIEPITIGCDEIVSGDTADTEQNTEVLDGYSCTVGSYHAPEVVYAFTATESREHRFRLIDASPTDINHDLFALEGDPTGNLIALRNSCIGTGMNSLVFDAVAGRTYLLVVDGYANDSGPFTARLECQ